MRNTGKTIINTLVKSPDAALRFILSHCSVRQVRFIPLDLRALPVNFLRARPKNGHFQTFYDFIIISRAGAFAGGTTGEEPCLLCWN
jgi:hypothetical protein